MKFLETKKREKNKLNFNIYFHLYDRVYHLFKDEIAEKRGSIMEIC